MAVDQHFYTPPIVEEILKCHDADKYLEKLFKAAPNYCIILDKYSNWKEITSVPLLCKNKKAPPSLKSCQYFDQFAPVVQFSCWCEAINGIEWANDSIQKRLWVYLERQKGFLRLVFTKQLKFIVVPRFGTVIASHYVSFFFWTYQFNDDLR